jgi:hypothetical protein
MLLRVVQDPVDFCGGVARCAFCSGIRQGRLERRKPSLEKFLLELLCVERAKHIPADACIVLEHESQFWLEVYVRTCVKMTEGTVVGIEVCRVTARVTSSHAHLINSVYISRLAGTYTKGCR